MLRSLCQKLKLDFECDTPLKFVTTQWQHDEKCLTYVIYRWIYFLFYTFSFINSIVFSIRQNQLMLALIYLTRWNLAFTMIASGLATYYVTEHYRSRKLKKPDKMRLGMKVYWFMFNSIPIYGIWITLIYWTLIYDGRSINLNNLLTHVTNFVGPVIDLFIVNHPYYVSHSVFPMICSVMYIFFTVFYQLLGGLDINGRNYVYPILDWKDKPLLALKVSVTAIFCAGFFHLIFCGVQHLRTKVHSVIVVKKEKITEQSMKFIVVETA